MQKPVLLAAIFASSLLAACGGGGGGGPTPPTPSPTHTPGVSFASKLVFVGGLAGASIQSDLRRAQSVHTMDASTAPIMVVSEPESGLDASAYGGQVEAEVSPLPAAPEPAVTFTQDNPNAVLSTPAPGASPQPLPTGIIAEAIVTGANAVQAQSAGTASATIGDPVNQTPTAPVYSYMSIVLDCNSGYGVLGSAYTTHFGWKWTGSTWTVDDNVSDADVYIDGPSCVAANPSESDVTVHVPGGDTRLSTDSAFNSVTASQWANGETSFTLTQAITSASDGSQTALVIGKTRDGSTTFKLFPNGLSAGQGFFGAVEVSGDSVDGF